jgi:hydrogenase/urease accessory protein HupE
MRRLRAFGRFWWDFVVGDDPLAAAAIVLAIGLTAALAAAGVAAWWLMPLAVAAVLTVSLRREARRAT